MSSTPAGNDLLAQIENDNPKLGIYLRRYIVPSIQSRGLPGQVLMTPPDAAGPVQLQPISDVIGANGVTKIIAGTNVTISPPTGIGAVTVNSTAGAGGGGLFVPVTPTGVQNSVNQNFTLPDAPSPTGSYVWWLNGVEQIAGVDITVTGNIGTFTVPPRSYDIQRVIYTH